MSRLVPYRGVVFEFDSDPTPEALATAKADRDRELGSGLTKKSGEDPSFWTAMRAGAVDDPQTQIKIYAAARFPNEPPEVREARYSVNDGNLVFVGDDGKLYSEGKGRRTIGKIAAQIPAMALGVPAARWGITAAGAGGAVGEIARKLYARAEGDDQSFLKDYILDPTLVGLLEGGGALVGQGVNLARTRLGLQRGGPIARQARQYLDQIAPQEALDAEARAKTHGIALTPVEASKVRGLSDDFTLAADLPETAAAAQKLKETRKGQIRDAVTRFMDDLRGGRDVSPFDAASSASEAAEKSIHHLEDQAKTAASPHYRLAFGSGARVDVQGALAELDAALKRLPEEGSTAAKTLGRIRQMLHRTEKQRLPLPGQRRAVSKTLVTEPMEDFPSPKAEADALRARTNPGYRPDPKALAVKTGEGFTPEDRSILLAVGQALEPGSYEARVALKAAKGSAGLSPWERMKAQELLEAGRKSVTGPIPDLTQPATPENLPPLPDAGGRVRTTGSLDKLAQRVEVPTQEVRVPEYDLERLDVVKKEIDALLDGSSPDLKNITPAVQKGLRARLQAVKTKLVGAMDTASPEYAKGRSEHARFVPDIERSQKGLVGQMARKESDYMNNAGKALFDSQASSPEAVRWAKKQIQGVNPQAWDDLVAARLQSTLEEIRSRGGKDVLNLGGRYFDKVFGTPTQQAIWREALGPERYRGFRDLMDALDRTRYLFGKESATAPRSVRIEQLKKGGLAGKAVSASKAATQPVAALRTWMEDVVFGANQQALYAALTNPRALDQLSRVRLIPANSQRFTRELSTFLANVSRGAYAARDARGGFGATEPYRSTQERSDSR